MTETDWPSFAGMLLEHTQGKHDVANPSCGACQIAAGTFDAPEPAETAPGGAS